MPTLSVRTQQSKQVVDLTRTVEEVLREEGFDEGVCNLFVTHTTAALSTAVLDPGTDLDIPFAKILEKIV